MTRMVDVFTGFLNILAQIVRNHGQSRNGSNDIGSIDGKADRLIVSDLVIPYISQYFTNRLNHAFKCSHGFPVVEGHSIFMSDEI